MTLEELQVILTVNNQQLVSGIQDSIMQMNKLNTETNKSVNKIKNSFGGFKKFVVGLGIGKVLKDSIMAGVESVESENRFSTLFKGFSSDVRAWSEDLQKSLGINEYAARSAASNFFELATAQGISADTAKDMAKNLTMTGYDISSFKDKDISQVLNAMQSAFVGNTEALRSMGYVVTADMVKQEAYAKGIAKTGTELTQTQKAMATYSLIMKQAGEAHGDLARTIDSPSNQLRILKDSLQNLRIEFGKAFNPILSIVLPILNAFVQKLIQVAKIVSAFTQALFGKKKEQSSGGGIEDTTANLGDLTGAYNDTADAAKKAKKQVMGFDEVNTLSDADTADVSGGIGNIEMPDLDTGDGYDELIEIPEKVQQFADKIKSIFNGVKDFLMEHKEAVIAIVGGIVAGFAIVGGLSFVSGIFTAIGTAIAALATPAVAAGVAIGALAALFIYLWQTNDEFRNKMTEVWNNLTGIVSDFWNNTLAPFADYYVNGFIGPIVDGFQQYMMPVLAEMLAGSAEIFVSMVDLFTTSLSEILDVVKPILELVKDVYIDCMRIIYEFWQEHGQRFIDNVVEFVGKIKEEALKIWNEIVEPILIYAIDMLRKVWEEHLSGMIEKFLDFVGKLVNGALEIYNKFLDPIIKWLVDLLGPTVVNVFKFIIDIIENALVVIIDVAGGVFEVLGGICDFLTGVFTGDWEKAWEGVVSIFKGIWDGLVAIVKYPINAIISMINVMIRGLNRIKLPDWLPGIGGFGINIPEIPKLAQGGIVNKPTTALIGEAGPEMVVPLKNTPFVNSLANAVSGAVYASLKPLVSSESQYNSEATGGTDLILSVNGMTFGKVAIESINQVTKANGKCLLRL